jgi:hypothetical protein
MLRVVYESRLPTSAPVVVVPAEAMPDNIFRRRGGGWQVRFRGRKDFTVLPGKGADYLHELLVSQGESMPAIGVVCGAAAKYCGHLMDAKVAADEGLLSASNPMLETLGAIADWEAVNQYRDEARRLLGEVESARSDRNETLVRELEGQIADLVDTINGAVSIGGKLKQAGDKRKNIRDGFRNNVNRVIEKIRHTDAGLADHLRSSITFGNSPVYRPESFTPWELSPIVNE